MIKIIKLGEKKKIICPECGCYFSYEKEDIEISNIITPFSRFNIFSYEKYISCPQCKEHIILEATK